MEQVEESLGDVRQRVKVASSFVHRSHPMAGPIVLSTSEPPTIKSYLSLVKMHVKICRYLLVAPFDWDLVQDKMCLYGGWQKSFCKFQIAAQTLYTLIMGLYFLSPAVQGTMKTSNKMMTMAFLICFIATMFMRRTSWTYRKELTHLINNFISFEDKFLEDPRPGWKSKGDKVTRALLALGIGTGFGLPGLMITMLLVSPCKAPHIGFILFRTGEHGEECLIPGMGWKVRLSILLFDAWMWVNAIAPACVVGFQMFFMGLNCFSSYLSILYEFYRDNRRTEFTNDIVKHWYCMGVYRHLQVLARLYNTCLSRVFIPTQIAAACFVLIIGLYSCIRLYSQVPMPGFLFFPLLVADGMAIIFISQVASGVYIRSTHFVKAIRASRRHMRKSAFHKVTKASSFIKVRFGATNYIDQLSPLNYMNFCLTQTISLIMLSGDG